MSKGVEMSKEVEKKPIGSLLTVEEFKDLVHAYEGEIYLEKLDPEMTKEKVLSLLNQRIEQIKREFFRESSYFAVKLYDVKRAIKKVEDL